MHIIVFKERNLNLNRQLNQDGRKPGYRSEAQGSNPRPGSNFSLEIQNCNFTKINYMLVSTNQLHLKRQKKDEVNSPVSR